jgi:wyosine [tRNA(Phe)-imidazoG37] synthetase (radical SAM superfamily)
MSGGMFDYKQYELQQIADDIEQHIVDREEINWDYKYKDETIAEFKRAVEMLRRAYIYVQRIDWLVSADDSESTFHKRLNQQLKEYDENHHPR